MDNLILIKIPSGFNLIFFIFFTDRDIFGGPNIIQGIIMSYDYFV